MRAKTVRTEVRRREALDSGLVGMILFIASEVMFFAGLFAVYWNIRADAPTWPPDPVTLGLEPEAFDLHIWYGAILLAILLSSSLTTLWAESSIRKGDRGGFLAGLFATLALGVTFLILKTVDFRVLEEFDMNDGPFGATYFTLTGFHGAHVLGGVLALAVLFVAALRGAFSTERHVPIQAFSYYWHFVDVVWISLFVQLYLLK
jgi:cytochrome c oxidase subunit 3